MRPARTVHSLVSTAMMRPSRRTGIASIRPIVGSSPSALISPSTLTPAEAAWEMMLDSTPSAHEPDVVGDVHRLVRRRTDLIGHEPATIAGLDVEQQVGEAEIGEETPLGGEPVQMVDVVAPESGVLA